MFVLYEKLADMRHILDSCICRNPCVVSWTNISLEKLQRRLLRRKKQRAVVKTDRKMASRGVIQKKECMGATDCGTELHHLFRPTIPLGELVNSNLVA